MLKAKGTLHLLRQSNPSAAWRHRKKLQNQINKQQQNNNSNNNSWQQDCLMFKALSNIHIYIYKAISRYKHKFKWNTLKKKQTSIRSSRVNLNEFIWTSAALGHDAEAFTGVFFSRFFFVIDTFSFIFTIFLIDRYLFHIRSHDSIKDVI